MEKSKKLFIARTKQQLGTKLLAIDERRPNETEFTINKVHLPEVCHLLCKEKKRSLIYYGWGR